MQDERPDVGAGDAARVGRGGLGATIAAADGAALGATTAVHGFTTPATTNTTMPSATATGEIAAVLDRTHERDGLVFGWDAHGRTCCCSPSA